MPRLQDFRGLIDNFKWFLGFGERLQFDRWTYWEKFDYLAVFWGILHRIFWTCPYVPCVFT